MKTIKYILFVLSGVLILACQDESRKAEDHFINYEIEEYPVEQDFVVGAFYNSFMWSNLMTEVPEAGLYDGEFGDPTAYQQHVTWAQTGGIDYFLLQMRSAIDPVQFSTDSTFIAKLHEASNATEINFALRYNFGSMDLENDNRIEDAGLVDQFINDFKAMKPFFNQSNYMKLGDKHVVMIQGASELHSNDNAALYEQLRTAMSAEGVEFFIIGTQPRWTPPMRYDFRFVNGVDAVSHESYVRNDIDNYDRWILFPTLCDQALTYSQAKLAEHNLEYIPQFSPSYNGKVGNLTNTDFVIEKDHDWFTTYCNIAKRSSSTNRMVILDSFNDWNQDKQIEPAQSYGEEYLNILRKQFKIN
jgi:hypothetical protein